MYRADMCVILGLRGCGEKSRGRCNPQRLHLWMVNMIGCELRTIKIERKIRFTNTDAILNGYFRTILELQSLLISL